MYPWLRNIHLLLAVLALPFLLVYSISAIQMAHSKWLRWKPKMMESHVAMAPGNEDARALARELMDQHGLRGDLQQVSTTPAGLHFSIVRPGTVCDIEYNSATGDTKILTMVAGFLGMLNRLHHAAGFWHSYWLTNVWNGFVLWTSIVIILLGVSGVWLWFARRQDRMIGIVLLAVNLGASLTLLCLIRFP